MDKDRAGKDPEAVALDAAASFFCALPVRRAVTEIPDYVICGGVAGDLNGVCKFVEKLDIFAE